MKKVQLSLGFVLILVLSLSLLLAAGCSGSATPTATTPGATQQTIRTEIAAARPSHPYFPITIGLSQYINKESALQRITTIAVGGIGDPYKMLIDDPSRRTNTFIIYAPPFDTEIVGEARKGQVVKYIAPISILHFPIVTLDPNIKSIYDLAGKTVGLPRTNAAHFQYFVEMFKLAGIYDSVKIINAGEETHAPALTDGQIAAAQIGYDYIFPNTFALSAALQQVQSRGKIYFVDQPEDLITKAFAKWNIPPMYTKVPANSLPNQPNALTVMAWPYYYAADAAMPDNLVYDFTKILYSHAGDYGQYHNIGKGMTKEFVTLSPYSTDAARQANYANGTLQYFQENNIQLKSFGD